CADHTISIWSVMNSQPRTACLNRPVFRFCRAQIAANSNAADIPLLSSANSQSSPSRCSASGSYPAIAHSSATSGPRVSAYCGPVLKAGSTSGGALTVTNLPQLVDLVSGGANAFHRDRHCRIELLSTG